MHWFIIFYFGHAGGKTIVVGSGRKLETMVVSSPITLDYCSYIIITIYNKIIFYCIYFTFLRTIIFFLQ